MTDDDLIKIIEDEANIKLFVAEMQSPNLIWDNLTGFNKSGADILYIGWLVGKGIFTPEHVKALRV